MIWHFTQFLINLLTSISSPVVENWGKNMAWSYTSTKLFFTMKSSKKPQIIQKKGKRQKVALETSASSNTPKEFCFENSPYTKNGNLAFKSVTCHPFLNLLQNQRGFFESTDCHSFTSATEKQKLQKTISKAIWITERGVVYHLIRMHTCSLRSFFTLISLHTGLLWILSNISISP